MKKISKLVLSTVVILALCLTMFSFNALAAGSASIAFSNQSPTVADTVTVKVTVSAPNMYGINITGTYNEEVLSYVSGASSAGAGIFQIAETESFNGESSKSFSIVFKAKKAGSSPITFSGQVSCQETVGTLPVDVDVSASATLTVKDVTLSSNANLKYLRPSAGSLSPKFSQNVTEYTVNVKKSVTECKIYADTVEPGAKVAVSGSATLKVGNNTRVVTVTAPSGAQKAYTITIIRSADEDETESNTSSEAEVNTALETIIGGKSYVVLSDITDVTIPKGFSITSRLYNNEEISVATDEKGLYELFFLKQSGSNEAFPYTYDENANAFTRVLIINQLGKSYIVAEIGEDLKVPGGYTKKTFEIDGMSIDGYVSSDADLEDMYYIYCYIEGEFGTYRYDIAEKVLQRSPEFKLIEIDETQTDSKIEIFNRFAMLSSNAKTIVVCLCIAFLGMIALLVLIIIKFIKRNSYDDFDADDSFDEDFDSVTFDDDYKIENQSEETEE